MFKLFISLLLFISLIAAERKPEIGVSSDSSLVQTGSLGPRQKEVSKMDKSFLSIVDLIKSKKDKKQIDILTHFAETFQKGHESILITESIDCYEIIVSHRYSSDDETVWASAEQYFLDKKTGEWKMGWHETPMKTEHYIIEQIDPAPSPDGKNLSGG